eukprot:scaffold589180_cov29-Prasinocladus_malaysianus.AAC.1
MSRAEVATKQTGGDELHRASRTSMISYGLKWGRRVGLRVRATAYDLTLRCGRPASPQSKLTRQ